METNRLRCGLLWLLEAGELMAKTPRTGVFQYKKTLGRLGLVAAFAAAIEDDRWIVCRPLQKAHDLLAGTIFNIIDNQGLEKKSARQVPKLLRSG